MAAFAAARARGSYAVISVLPPRDDSSCQMNAPMRYCASASVARASAALRAHDSARTQLPCLK